jgi:Skp family chaperone for outer membrane proteins
MYKKISIVLALIIIALLAYYNFYIVEPKIGVINMDKLLQESTRAKELQSDLVKKGKELENKYDKIDEENEDLEDKKDQIYMEYAQNKQELEKQLNDEINQIIDELNNNNKYSIILYKNKVYFGGEDITEKVIQLLDDKFAEVDQNEAN